MKEVFGKSSISDMLEKAFLLRHSVGQAARVVSLGGCSVAAYSNVASPAARAADWQAMLAASRGPGYGWSSAGAQMDNSSLESFHVGHVHVTCLIFQIAALKYKENVFCVAGAICRFVWQARHFVTPHCQLCNCNSEATRKRLSIQFQKTMKYRGSCHRCTPKSSILVGFFIKNQPCWGSPI